MDEADQKYNELYNEKWEIETALDNLKIDYRELLKQNMRQAKVIKALTLTVSILGERE
jgi:IS4 transposase